MIAFASLLASTPTSARRPTALSAHLGCVEVIRLRQLHDRIRVLPCTELAIALATKGKSGTPHCLASEE